MRRMVVGCLAGLSLMCGAMAHAQDPVAESESTRKQLSVPDPDRWWFEITPYLWLSAVGTDAEIGPVSAEADASFSDILDDLSGALMLHAEAHKGPWGMFGDIMWVRIEKDESIGPMGGGNLDVEIGTLFLEVGGLYRFGTDRFSFEPLFGMRAAFVNTEVTITGGAGGDAGIDSDTSWAEPMIGARLAYRFSEKWSWGLRGDVSGFGVGSEITWNVNTGIRYQINDLFGMWFAYRYMFIDYEDGMADIEITMNGPLLGFTFTF